MNCRRFQDELFEYVEGALSADALGAVQRHLAGCHACRQAVKREQRLATALSSRLRQSSQSLTLHPDVRRNILAACRQKGSAPMVTASLIDLCKYWLRLAVIPVAMLMVAGILVSFHFSGTKSRRVSTPIPPRLATATSPAGNNPRPSISVQISYHLPRHEFHKEGNTVVDAFVTETVVVDETIPSGTPKNLPRGIEMKTPL